MPKKLKEQVEKILRNVVESRNSDITLTIEVWKHFYSKYILTSPTSGNQAVPLKALYDLPREDAIKRIRAMFNADGKYFPTDWKVAKRRGIKEDEWRVACGYPTKADTVHPTKGDSYMDEERDFNSKDLFNN